MTYAGSHRAQPVFGELSHCHRAAWYDFYPCAVGPSLLIPEGMKEAL